MGGDRLAWGMKVCLRGLGWHEDLASCLAWVIDGLLARLGVA